jgi:hypothetical protein
MLLNVDGLDKKWEKGVKSDFEGELGWHSPDDVEKYGPVIFRRVNSGIQGQKEMDLSSKVTNDDYVFGEEVQEPYEERDGKTYQVISLSNKKLRDNLVVNFHMRWSNGAEFGDIVWPSRTGKVECA